MRVLEKDETIALELSCALIRATFATGLGTKKTPAEAVKMYQEVLAELRKG